MKINIEKLKSIIFDLDGTLTADSSWLNITDKLGADQEVHQKIFQDFKEGVTTYTTAKKLLINLWKQTGNCTKEHFNDIFNNSVLTKETLHVVNTLSKKYKLCIISGSVDLNVESIARRLGIKDYFSNTKLIFDINGNLIDFNYEKDQAKKKLIQLNEYMEKYKYTPDECMAVGDSENDILVFKTIPSVAIVKNTQIELEKYAVAKIEKIEQLLEVLDSYQ